MVESALIYSAIRSCVPARYQQTVRRALYTLKDFKDIGLPNILEQCPPDTFRWVNFELNGECNYNNCWYCPNSVAQGRRGIMSDKIFQTMVSQLAQVGQSGFKGTINPNFFGEPTVHKGLLIERVKALRECLPDSTIIIHSNGICLTADLFRELIKSGTDRFIVTRHPGSFSHSLDTMLAQLTDEERSVMVDRTLDDIKLLNTVPHVEIPPERVSHLERCRLPSEQVTITNSGDVVLCCRNFDADIVCGNIMNDNITSIWKEEGYRNERNNLRMGVFSQPNCKSCMGKE